jgi:hypothetical protein
MAERPVYIPEENGFPFVTIKSIMFDWFAGFSVSQKQKSIKSLHLSIEQTLGISKTLEISSKSLESLGNDLSAFNLKICTVKKQKIFSVECGYQASKVFEFGGPYLDILDKTSREAKTDPRLKSSGKLIGFRFYNVDWELEPKTAFYDWLYLNALKKNFELTESMARYSAFTDIEFNPMKSISCQARSAALYIALEKRNLLNEALSSKDNFLYILKNSFSKEDNYSSSQQDFHYS